MGDSSGSRTPATAARPRAASSSSASSARSGCSPPRTSPHTRSTSTGWARCAGSSGSSSARVGSRRDSSRAGGARAPGPSAGAYLPRGKEPFQERFVLTPLDNLHVYFRGEIERRYGAGYVYVVFDGPEMVAAFKAKRHGWKLSVTEFLGDERGRGVLRGG